MLRLRMVVATGVALAGGGGLFAGQVVLGSWLGFLRPFEVWSRSSSDESIYFHLFLVEWFALTGIVLATLLARVASGSAVTARRHAGLVAAAGLGAGVAMPLVTGFVRSADPAGASLYTGGYRADLVWLAAFGVALGVVTAALLVPVALRRGIAVWIAWTWLVFGCRIWANRANLRSGLPYTLDPLGVIKLRTSYNTQAIELASLGVTLLLVGGLAWWSARRRERWPAAGAMTGPLVIVVAYLLALRRLPGSGDHYGLVEDLAPWLIIALAGAGLAVLFGYLGGLGRREVVPPRQASSGQARSGQAPSSEAQPGEAPPGEAGRVRPLAYPAAVRPATRVFLTLGGCALWLAAFTSLSMPAGSSGRDILAAAGATALLVAGLATGSLRPGRILAATTAMCGVAAMFALEIGLTMERWTPLLAPTLAVGILGMGAIGALATVPRGAAWFGLVAGAVHSTAAATAAVMDDPHDEVWQDVSFSIASAAFAMLSMTAALLSESRAQSQAQQPSSPVEVA